MPARIHSVLLIAMLGGAILLHGQSQPDNNEPISTDRPAIAESSVVVPKGSFQAENGMLVTNDNGQRSLDAPETSLRYGLAGNTELHFSAPDYYLDTASATGAVSGFGDLTVGNRFLKLSNGSSRGVEPRI